MNPEPLQLLFDSNTAGVVATAADIDLTPRRHLFQPSVSRMYAEDGALVVHSSFNPHEKQIELLNSGARFRVVFAGRRGGKTKSGAEEVVRHGLGIPGAKIWVVAPTHPMAKIPISAILEDTVLGERPELIAKYRRTENEIILCNGSRIEVKSAEWEDTLRGGGNDFVWCDEVQMMKESAFKILEATTADTLGRILITGTPFGQSHWTYRLWQRGTEADKPDWASWRFPSTCNPMVSETELARARADAPSEDWFRQEYLAEFVDSIVSVFGDLQDLIVDDLPSSAWEKGVVLGVDLAMKRDYSAVVAETCDGEVLETTRFNKESWALQRERILEFVTRHGDAPIVIDSSRESAIAEDLERAGCWVLPIDMRAGGKQRDLIEQLMLDCSRGRVCIPAEHERLLYEMRIYQRGLTKHGNPKYSAPSGEHDDMVVALALANWGIRRQHMASSDAALEIVMNEDTGLSGPRSPERSGLFLRTHSSVWGTLGRHGFMPNGEE